MATPLSPVKTSISSGAQRLPKLDWLGRLNVTTAYKLEQKVSITPRVFTIIANTNQLPYDSKLVHGFGNWLVRSITGYSAATQSGMLRLIDFDGSVFNDTDPPPSVYYTIAQWPLGPGATFSFDSPVYSHSSLAVTDLRLRGSDANHLGLWLDTPDGGGVSFTAILEPTIVEV